MTSITQRSFAGGELGPALYGRADQTKYQTGARTVRNFIVRKEGGVENRPGTRFVKEVKTSALATYLAKFVYDDTQTYVIEAGNGYFRFIREGAQIIVAGVTAWSALTNYIVGDLASRLGVNYYCILAHINHQPANATYWYPLTGVIYEIPTPYATADLPDIHAFQRGDVVTLMHPSYDTRELRRTGHTAWTLVPITYAPSITPPINTTNSDAGAGGDTWVVTAIKSETREESVASASTSSNSAASPGFPVTVSWNQLTGSQEYRVYKLRNGVNGFVGTAGDSATPAFRDEGVDPDFTITPPMTRNPFNGANNRPATGTIYQQRRVFGYTGNNPESVEGSRSGMYSNFSKSSPLQDDDAISFTVGARKVQAVRHLVELDRLIILTASGALRALGDSNGVLSATQPPNLERIYGSGGANKMQPIIIADTLIYTQARSNIVRDMKPDIAQGYASRDLTVFSPHLFKGRTLTRWDYAEIPNSVVWAVRSDGTLLGLTYLREHEVWGWHRHDTDGSIEDVVCVPEGAIDAVYMVVKRTINGSTKRYIERLANPFVEAVDDITTDAFFVDSGLTYNGWNTDGVTTMRATTAGGWTYEDELTIARSAGTFSPGTAEVGNSIVLTRTQAGVDYQATIIISEYVDATHVKGFAIETVPALLRDVALTSWGKGVDQLSGLDHLEAKSVSVLGDGNVLANPNNGDYDVITVTSGAIALARPYVVIHVGLPFTSDLETLDMDVNGQEIRDVFKNITSISLLVESTRGVFVGPDADNLRETPPESQSIAEPVPLVTGLIEVGIDSTWEQTGRFLVRQIDPIPIAILSAIPNGDLGG